MRISVIDIILGLVVLALIIVLVIAVSTKVPEPFTELYFENHTGLPAYSSQGTFVFSVNNLENKDMQYEVLIRGESETANLTIKDFLVTIGNGQKKTFRADYGLPPDFGTGRIIVELPEQNQSIHFWTTYARNIVTYFGKEQSADCVPEIETSGDITVKIHGTNESNAVVLLNGLVAKNITLSGETRFTLDADGYLDIWFTNDQYNQTAGVDRNLFLDYVKAGDLYYEKVLIDQGSGNAAFDCLRTSEGNALYSNGAFRVKIKKLITIR